MPEDLEWGGIGRLMRIEALRPMSTQEVVDTTTKVFREVGARVLRPTLGAATLVYIAITLTTQVLFPQLFLTRNPDDLLAQLGEVLLAVLIGVGAAFPVFAIGFAWVSVHATFAVSDYFSGRNPHEEERLRRADQHLPRAIKLAFRVFGVALAGPIVGLLMLVLAALLNVFNREALSALSGGVGIFGLLVSVIIFLVVLVRQALAPSALLLEGLSPKEAMRRSSTLLKGFRGATGGDETVVTLGVLLILVSAFLIGGVSFIYSIFNVTEWLTTLVGRHWWGEMLVALVVGLPNLLGLWIIAPLGAIGSAVIYHERRIRLEGHDIEILHHELASKNRR